MKIRNIITILLATVVLVTVLEFSTIKDFLGIGDDNTEVVVDVEQGEGLKSIAQKLEEKGIIEHKNIFYLYAKSKASGFQYGGHIFTPDMSYREVAFELSTAGNSDTVSVVIPEGYELRLIAQAYAKTGIVTAGEFMKAASEVPVESYGFLTKGLDDLEGYLFPATYDVAINSTAETIVDNMLEAFANVYTDEHIKKAKELGMSTHDIITLASIIEREAANEAEHKKVAGVFYNRIKDGMKLQSCATVQYILKERKPVLSIADTEIDSPYNTYMYEGLPPGPIASPGKSAIDAALWPEEHDYYYFVAKSDGSGHVFSKTFEEHQRAVSQNQ